MLPSRISALLERRLYNQTELVAPKCVIYNLMHGYLLQFIYFISLFIKCFMEAITLPDLLLINSIIILQYRGRKPAALSLLCCGSL